jgi:phosphate transport system protein
MVAALRSQFDRQLETLQRDVLRLAEMVNGQINQAVKAQEKRDMGVAWRVDTYDSTVNRLRCSIEEQAYTLLALQQPNAGDMRRIVAAVSIVTNLERMGDHAAGIARIVLAIPEGSPTIAVPEFADMTALITKNLNDTMDAYLREDHVLAQDVAARDHAIDVLHHQVYMKMIALMTENKDIIEQATKVLWVSHNLERISDRIANICERISYVATGVLYETPHDAMS